MVGALGRKGFNAMHKVLTPLVEIDVRDLIWLYCTQEALVILLNPVVGYIIARQINLSNPAISIPF